jgi:hypothetical protein
MRGKSRGLPRFLRRHYPHQVQGVRPTVIVGHLSQAAPPHFVCQNKTGPGEVNYEDIVERLCQTPLNSVRRFTETPCNR